MRNIWCLALISFVVGCQQNSEKIEYKGIGEKQAVQLLSRARAPGQQTGVIEKIRRDSRYGFAWDVFWNQIRQEDLIKNLQSQQRDELLNLFSMSCSQTAYEAFAKVIFTQSDTHHRMFSTSNQCSFALSEQLYLDYFSFYRSKVLAGEEAAFELFSQLIVRQTPKGEVTPYLRNSFNSISSANWSQMVERGLEKNKVDAIMALIDIYEKVYSSYELADVLIKPALVSEGQFQTLLKNFGFVRTLDLLQRIPQTYYTTLKDQKINLESPLAIMVQAYSKQAYKPLDSYSLAEQAYRDFLNIVNFIELVENNVRYETLFKLTDAMFVNLEKWIKTDRLSQVHNRFDPSIFLLWTKYRLGEEITENEIFEALKTQQSKSPWLDALQDLILIHMQKQEHSAHTQVQQFCEKLEALGIGKKQVSVATFSSDILKTPGCVKIIDVSEDSIINIEAQTFDMNIASVLSTSGASLNIKANVINASVIDLANTQTHPDLPVEITPVDANAVVFPVLVGLQILNDTGIYAPGFYYMLTHFTWRKAAAGAPSASTPLKGFSGGDLKALAEHILPFKALSYGGDGQKAAPRLLGGQADISVIDPYNVSLEFSSLAGVPPGRRLMSRPSIRTIQHLLKFAERNEQNRIRIYTDTDIWWRNLSTEQKQKISIICNAQIPDHSCSHRLAEQAIQQLVSEISANDLSQDENFILERLASTTYSESHGALGPVNPMGDRGDSGIIQLSIEGKQK